MPLAALTIFKAAAERAGRGPVATPSSEIERIVEGVSKSSHVSEAVALVTCERAEVYMVVERFHGAIADARDCLARVLDVPVPVISEVSIDRHDEGVVRHLFGVAAGLDSKVVGETEILGQVSRAWDLAREQGTSRSVLNDLFRHALVTGKRARSETAVASGVRTVGAAALRLIDGAADKNTLLIGTGDAATSVAHAVARSAPSRFTIASRSHERADVLAARVGAVGVHVAEMRSHLRAADLVISATTCVEPLLDVGDANEMPGPVTIVDLGEPPNVDVGVADLGHVSMFCLDDVRKAMEGPRQRRMHDVADVSAIVEDECTRYLRNTERRSVDPLIVDLRARAEHLRTAELERFAARLESFDPEQRRIVEELTGALTAKFVHAPTVELKAAVGTPDAGRMVESARKLFDL